MPDEEMMMTPEVEMMMVSEEMMVPEEEMMVMMMIVTIAVDHLRICRNYQAKNGRGGQCNSNSFQHGSLLFSPLCLSPFPL